MSITRRLSRRRFLRVSGLAAGGLTLPCLVFAQNKKAVHFTLPWVAEGSNLFTFVAKGMGFWEKHRLDVDIARGSGSVAAAQAIGEARFDFGMCSPSAAILQTVNLTASVIRNSRRLPDRHIAARTSRQGLG